MKTKNSCLRSLAQILIIVIASLISLTTLAQTQSIIIPSTVTQSQLNAAQLARLNRLSGSQLHENFQLMEVQNLVASQVDGKVRLILSNLPCPDLTFSATKVVYTSENDYYWHGIINSEVDASCQGGSLILMAKGGEKFGTIIFDDYSYEFQELGDGVQAFSRFKTEMIDENECGVNSNTFGFQGSSNSKKDTASSDIIYSCSLTDCVVRVLVLWTQNAENIEANINNRIALAIAQTNQAYQNSQVGSGFEGVILAGSQKITFNETTNQIQLDANTLANRTDVQTLRNNLQADIVILLTNGNYGATFGIVKAIGPNFNGAYSITQTNAATGGRFTFAHEVGHLFGARHNDDTNGTIEHGYSFTTGFIFTKHRYTLLASMPAGKTRELNYSNPDVKIKNKPTGTSFYHNNAQQHRITGCTVANFFPPVGMMSVDIRQPNPNVCCTTVTAEAEVACGTAPFYFNWTISYDGINWVLLPNSEIVTFNTDCDKTILIIELAVTDANGQFKVIRKYYNADCGQTYLTGIKTEKLENESSGIIKGIFPNPANANFKIELNLPVSDYLSIDLLDASGIIRKKILGKLISEGNRIFSVNTSDLYAGIYTLRVVTKQKTENRQIIITK